MADEEILHSDAEEDPEKTDTDERVNRADFKEDGKKKDAERSVTANERAIPTLALTVETATEEHQAPALMYPVVGFGASAGGLQAFREILENLDPNTGMSFVLVTHLAPDQKSFLSEIVERYTQMPVVSIENGQRPEAKPSLCASAESGSDPARGDFSG